MHEAVVIASDKIILGTMRLLEHNRTVSEWSNFFEDVYDLGIRTLHSSSEYDSFPLLCEILGSLKRSNPSIRFRHIIKLANPSFDEDGFSLPRLKHAIGNYRNRLQSDRIEDVQWMWRNNLSDENQRLADFSKSVSTITEAIFTLKSQALINRFFCFPYTTEFGQMAIEVPAVDGLVVYRNYEEILYDTLIDVCAERNKAAIIIRPFNGGATLRNRIDTPKSNLAFAINKPAIESAIISSGNLDHIRQLIAG
jgi:aryl-alcohol dehydrogenase-like predicted oxidoreductase